MFDRNPLFPNAYANTTFEFIREERFGRNREGLPVRAITSEPRLRYLSLDELRANDYVALKQGLISEKQSQILEENIKKNIEKAGLSGNMDGGLFDPNSPFKEILDKITISIKAEKGNTQTLLNAKNPTGGLFSNTSSIKGGSSYFTSTTGDQSLFSSTNHPCFFYKKPDGGLFGNNSAIKQTLPQSTATTGLFSGTVPSKVFAYGAEGLLNKNQENTNKSAIEIAGDASINKPSAEKIPFSNPQDAVGKPKEKSEETHQNLSTGKLEPKPKGFYQELTKMMFTATIMEVFEEYEAKVPEDLLENTDFMPKLFELFESYKIEFTKKIVPIKKVVSDVKLSEHANLEVKSNTKEL